MTFFLGAIELRTEGASVIKMPSPEDDGILLFAPLRDGAFGCTLGERGGVWESSDIASLGR